jgi:hypothetical protein
MSKRRCGWLVGLTVLAGTAALWLSLVLGGDRITWRSFQRIQVGMTQKEVEAILGGPPGEYAVPKIGLTRFTPPEGEWWGAEAIIVIEFTKERRVLRKWLYNPYLRPYQPNALDRARSWLGWL